MDENPSLVEDICTVDNERERSKSILKLMPMHSISHGPHEHHHVPYFQCDVELHTHTYMGILTMKMDIDGLVVQTNTKNKTQQMVTHISSVNNIVALLEVRHRIVSAVKALETTGNTSVCLVPHDEPIEWTNQLFSCRDGLQRAALNGIGMEMEMGMVPAMCCPYVDNIHLEIFTRRKTMAMNNWSLFVFGIAIVEHICGHDGDGDGDGDGFIEYLYLRIPVHWRAD